MLIQSSLLDIIETRNRISPYITRTPLHHYPSLDQLIGAEIHVKHENHQLLGAFKLRGALNVISQLSEAEKRAGVIAATSGNFGQGIAYAGRVFGVEANVVVPNNSNPGKVAAMRNLGAKLVFHGENFDESREHAEQLAEKHGFRYIHSANEPGLFQGTGTTVLEIFEDLPDVDVIIVPVGGGSGVCGACIVVQHLNPKVIVIGVESEAAPAAYMSWKKGEIVESYMESIAEGLATRVGFEQPQQIMRDFLDDFLLVSEEELKRAVILHIEHTHNLAEHAGAAPLAAAIKIKDRLKQKKVALIMTGGNLSLNQLKDALASS